MKLNKYLTATLTALFFLASARSETLTLRYTQGTDTLIWYDVTETVSADRFRNAGFQSSYYTGGLISYNLYEVPVDSPISGTLNRRSLVGYTYESMNSIAIQWVGSYYYGKIMSGGRYSIPSTGEINRHYFESMRKANRGGVSGTDWYSYVHYNTYGIYPGQPGGTVPSSTSLADAVGADGTMYEYVSRNELPVPTTVPNWWESIKTHYLVGAPMEPSLAYQTGRFTIGAPQIQMESTDSGLIRLRVVDFDGNPVPNERVDLECLAVAESVLLPHDDYNGDETVLHHPWFRMLVQSQYCPPIASGSSNPDDYFGQVLDGSVTTDEQGYAWFRVRYPNRMLKFSGSNSGVFWNYILGKNEVGSSDTRIRILACSSKGYLGYFNGARPASAGNVAEVEISYSKEAFKDDSQTYLVEPRAYRFYTFAGQVIDSLTGDPLEGVTVSLSGAYSRETVTDQDGFYWMDADFEAGSGTAPEQLSVIQFELEPQGTVVSCSKAQYSTVARYIALDNLTNYTVQGTVENSASSSPIEGATVSADGVSTTTDSSGNYTLVVNGGGPLKTVNFDFKQGSSGSLLISKTGFTQTGKSVDYTPDCKITGRVMYKQYPVRDAQVSLENEFSSGSVSVMTDSSGNFTITLGAGGETVSLGDVKFSTINSAELSKVIEQKSRMAISDSSIYRYYDVHSVDAFITAYPKTLAECSADDAQKVIDSATRLANVMLHLAQLDSVTKDYADRILDTLASLFSDLLEKTDIIKQWTEIPGDNPASDQANAMLDDVRESLNKLLRSFTAALGYSMSGSMNAQMQTDVRKFLDNLRANGTDAFKSEMREALLANGLRDSIQQQLDQAAQRCVSLSFYGDTATQKALAYQYVQNEHADMQQFVSSVEWQEYVNTLFSSVEEAAKTAKYVGSVVGWYKLIEAVENVSGKLSKVMSAGGAGQAMKAFSEMDAAAASAVQLDLGDLTALPSAPVVKSAPIAKAMEIDLGGLPDTNTFVQAVTALKGLVDSTNRSAVVTYSDTYLAAWQGYSRDCTAFIHLYEKQVEQDGAGDTAIQQLLDAQSTQMALMTDALGTGLRLAQEALGIDPVDYPEWSLLLNELLQSVADNRAAQQALAASTINPSAWAAIVDVVFPDGIYTSGVYRVEAVVANASAQSLSNLVVEVVGDSSVNASPASIAVGTLAGRSDTNLIFSCTLDSSAFGVYPAVQLRVSVGDVEHDVAERSIPVEDHIDPQVQLVWPEPDSTVLEADTLIFRIDDNSAVTNLTVDSLTLNGSPISVAGLHPDEDGWLIVPVSTVSGGDTGTVCITVSDPSGNTSVESGEFMTGDGDYPMFQLLARPADWFNPAETNWTVRYWAGASTNLQITVYNSISTAVYSETNSGTSGVHEFIWDGAGAPDGSYRVVVSINGDPIGARYVQLLDGSGPLRSLQVLSSEFLTGSPVLMELDSVSTGMVVCSGIGLLPATNTLDSGVSHLSYALQSSTPGLALTSPLEITLTLTTTGSATFVYTLLADDDRYADDLILPELSAIDASSNAVSSHAAIGTPLTVSLSGIPENEGYTSWLTVFDSNQVERLYVEMTPDGSGALSAAWNTAGLSKGSYTLAAQTVSGEGLPVITDPLILVLMIDADGDGMDDEWEAANGGDLSPDADPDGNGLTNLQEYLLDTNPNSGDSDGDGMDDGWEVQNGLDPKLDDSALDPDEDGLTNLEEFTNGSDPQQIDSDSDVLTDAEELEAGSDPLLTDTDSDGLTDYEEVKIYLTDPTSADSDGDGLPDKWEIERGMNPNSPSGALSDGDNDGLTNLQEYQNDTDPSAADTDGDGLSDSAELSAGTDPNDSDSDDDGLSDGWEASNGTDPLVDDADSDPDGDGLTNTQERQARTNPLDADSDGDTLPDAWEISHGLDPVDANGGLQGVSLVKAGDFTGIIRARGVVCSNGYAYVANGSDGLAIVDITSVTNMTLTGSLDTEGAGDGVAVYGTTVVIADGNYSLKVIDASNPAAPVLAGTVNAGYAQQVAMCGDIAYTAGSGLIGVVSVTNPAAPVLLAQIDMGTMVYDLEVVSNRLYAVADRRLSVFDLTDPSAPVLLDRLPLLAGRGVSAVGDRIYAAGYYDGLVSINASNETALAVLGAVTNSALYRIAAASDGLVYAVNGHLRIYDAYSSTAPVLAGQAETIGDASDVALHGGYVFVADYNGGLQVYIQETDADHDGLSDSWEMEQFGDLSQSGSDDADSDGISNAGEVQTGTDPLDDDSDDDGLSDSDEMFTCGTNPLDDDSDDDGYSDGYEVQYGSDPLDSWEIPGISIVTASLPVATERAAYSTTLFATNAVNGAPQWTWAVTNYTELRGSNTFAETGSSLSMSSSYMTRTIGLPFAFPTFGSSYTQCTVSTEGLISFGGGAQIYVRYGNTRTDYGGDVFMTASSNFVSFRWKGFSYWQTNTVNCSATLHADGRIALAYGDGNAPNPYGTKVGLSYGGYTGWELWSAAGSNALGNVQDIIFEPDRGLPVGMSLSLDGILSGTPTEIGTNQVSITVRDGTYRSNQKTFAIVVQPSPNQKPYVTGATPAAGAVAVGEATNRLFSVSATDPEGKLSYVWTLDGAPAGTNASYSFTTQWGDAGTNQLSCAVSDDIWLNWTSVYWTVTVLDDNDQDGLPNAWENTNGLNPWNPADAEADGDSDHLDNCGEYQAGTDPSDPDTDDDGLLDGWESLYGDPLNAPSSGGGGGGMSLTAGGWVPGEGRWFEFIQVVNGTLYLGDYSDTEVFSLTAPDDPQRLGGLGMADIASMLSVNGHTFLTRGWNGFGVYGLSNPVSAVEEAFFDSYQSEDLAVIGTTLFVSSADAPIHAFNISTPSSPSWIKTINAPDGQSYGLETDGTYLYAVFDSWTEGGGGLWVYDTDLNVVGNCSGFPGTSLKIEGTRAYTSHKNGGGIAVYDISNPATPVRLGQSTSITFGGFDVKDGVMYGCAGASVMAVNTVDPSALAVSETLAIDGAFMSKNITISGNYGYVAGGFGGMRVVSLGSGGDTDSDGDGMSDSWETDNLGGTSGDGSGDADGDGLTDKEEYLTGSNPNDSDSDDDGLSDGWEYRTGLSNPGDNSDTGLDRDNDGFTAYQEFIAGTDPLSGFSVFEVASQKASSGVQLSWSSVSGRVYSVWQSTNLTDWGVVSGQESISGDGTEKSVTPSAIGPRRYFRIKVEHP